MTTGVDAGEFRTRQRTRWTTLAVGVAVSVMLVLPSTAIADDPPHSVGQPAGVADDCPPSENCPTVAPVVPNVKKTPKPRAFPKRRHHFPRR